MQRLPLGYLTLALTVLVLGSQIGAGPAQANRTDLRADQVPYGVAADYLVGHHLLKEGLFQEALQFLHPAYRMHPDVPAIALDFQEALVAEGYLNDALEVMNRLLTTFPDSTDFILQRSRLNVQLGKTREALADLQKVRNQGYSSPEMIHAEAKLLAADGDVEQGVDLYRDGLELFPDQGAEFFLGMVRLLQSVGKTGPVLELLEEARAAYPDAPRLWLTSLHYLALEGRHEQALDLARQADRHFSELEAAALEGASEGEVSGEVTPSLGESFLVELADFYVQRGEAERAVSVLEPSAERGELTLNASLWLARIYLGTGQIAKGEPLVDEILRRWPDAGRAWFLRGKLMEARDNGEAAVKHLAHAAELSPTDAEIRLAYVRAMLVTWTDDLESPRPNAEQGRKREILEKQAVAALTLVPSRDTQGQLVLGYAFYTLDDPWRAEACFGRAAADPDLKITALTQQSLCFDEMGDTQKARNVLERLHEEFPEDAEIANSLGYFLAEKGQDLEKAQRLIDLALQHSPGSGAFLDSMGWVLYRQGDLEGAFDYLIQAVNVLPDDPVILEHLGMVMIELGQHQEGETMLRRSLNMGGDRERIQALLERLAAVDSSRTTSEQ